MEENTLPPQTTPQPAVQPEVTQVDPPSSNGGSKKAMIIVSVLLGLVVLAGALVYMRNQKQVTISAPEPTTVNAFDDLKKDLNSTDDGSSDADMKDVDSDLNSL